MAWTLFRADGQGLQVVATESPHSSESIRHKLEVAISSLDAAVEAAGNEHTDARVFSNQAGDRLAVYDADGLRVGQRRKWVSGDGSGLLCVRNCSSKADSTNWTWQETTFANIIV